MTPEGLERVILRAVALTGLPMPSGCSYTVLIEVALCGLSGLKYMCACTRVRTHTHTHTKLERKIGKGRKILYI